jgi:quinol monooxygenase YgiN
MLINAVIYTFPPEKAAEAKRTLVALRDASRTEAGCLAFDVAQDVDDANVYFLYEEWRDQAALDEHYASDHFQRFGVNGVRTLATNRIGHRCRSLD